MPLVQTSKKYCWREEEYLLQEMCKVSAEEENTSWEMEKCNEFKKKETAWIKWWMKNMMPTK